MDAEDWYCLCLSHTTGWYPGSGNKKSKHKTPTAFQDVRYLFSLSSTENRSLDLESESFSLNLPPFSTAMLMLSECFWPLTQADMEDLVISLLGQRLGSSNEKNHILYKEENSIQMLYFNIIPLPSFPPYLFPSSSFPHALCSSHLFCLYSTRDRI